MKYIRTKDNNIIDYQWVVKNNIPHIFVENRKYIDFNSDGRFEILKESDDIEELCDEFVGIRKNKAYTGKIDGAYWFEETKGWIGRLDSYEIIYGAIWTDKGLIYKAKIRNILSNGSIDWELL